MAAMDHNNSVQRDLATVKAGNANFNLIHLISAVDNNVCHRSLKMLYMATSRKSSIFTVYRSNVWQKKLCIT